MFSFLFSCPLTFPLSLKYCLLLCGVVDSQFIFSKKKQYTACAHSGLINRWSWYWRGGGDSAVGNEGALAECIFPKIFIDSLWRQFISRNWSTAFHGICRLSDECNEGHDDGRVSSHWCFMLCSYSGIWDIISRQCYFPQRKIMTAAPHVPSFCYVFAAC